jgi:tRNA-uridine 2-sulfurtransferase
VLSQRPFSQTKGALARIEKLAGAEILRPLSAKLLPPTEFEKIGFVKRHKLLDITGRMRSRQLELAEYYKIKEYATPAGGCLLTDPEFSNRLLKLLEHWPDCSTSDVQLLRYGRIFWLKLNNKTDNPNLLLLVGRNDKDNQALVRLAKRGDIVLELKEITGPTALLRHSARLSVKKQEIKINVPTELKMSILTLGEVKSQESIIDLAALLAAYYSPKARGLTAVVTINIIE